MLKLSAGAGSPALQSPIVRLQRPPGRTPTCTEPMTGSSIVRMEAWRQVHLRVSSTPEPGEVHDRTYCLCVYGTPRSLGTSCHLRAGMTAALEAAEKTPRGPGRRVAPLALASLPAPSRPPGLFSLLPPGRPSSQGPTPASAHSRPKQIPEFPSREVMLPRSLQCRATNQTTCSEHKLDSEEPSHGSFNTMLHRQETERKGRTLPSSR